MQTEYDIVIAGGGAVGASLACALADQPLRIAVIEPVSSKSIQQPSYDDRGLSLSLSSQRIFHSLDLWSAISDYATPIEHIHVSDRGHFGFVRLHASDLKLPAMGYVVLARELGKVLLERLSVTKNIDFICPATVTDIDQTKTDKIIVNIDQKGQHIALSSKLLVVADGSYSSLREKAGIAVTEKDYCQSAIVSNVTPQLSHNNTAYERFTDSGPLALLPLTDQRCVVVYTVSSEQEQEYMDMPDEMFLQKIQTRFGRRLGRMLKIGKRKSYKIKLLQPEKQYQDRILLLGNSAHTIHPNSAQGLNLGLRDVAMLAEQLILAKENNEDPGKEQFLADYCSLREKDQNRVIQFTDQLADTFYNNNPVKIVGRDMVMLLLDLIPGLKHKLMRQSMGLWGVQASAVYNERVSL